MSNNVEEKVPVVCISIPGHGVLILTPEVYKEKGELAGIYEEYQFKDGAIDEVSHETMGRSDFEALEDFRDL